MNIILQRTVSDDHGTRGTLTVGPLLLYTMEQPWRDNLPCISCVPSGEYQLIPYDSPKHGDTWCLHGPDQNIWGLPDPPTGMRTVCEIHTGNVVQDIEGCIVVGQRTGQISGEPAVIQSYAAFNQLVSVLEPMSVGHTLSIEVNGG